MLVGLLEALGLLLVSRFIVFNFVFVFYIFPLSLYHPKTVIVNLTTCSAPKAKDVKEQLVLEVIGHQNTKTSTTIISGVNILNNNNINMQVLAIIIAIPVNFLTNETFINHCTS